MKKLTKYILDRKALFVGLTFTFLIFLKNFWMFWNYSYAFFPDSNLYVHLGAQLFKTWYISPLVTFPYPLLNAMSGSFNDPTRLILVQILLSSLVGGFVTYVFARKDTFLGIATGLLLFGDLVSGALSRSILTDGLFGTLGLLAAGILLLHYDRREQLGYLELVFSGFLLSLCLSIRPSHIFLTLLIPFLYLWLTRSWKKVFALLVGFSAFFLCMGLINYRGTGQFYILSGKGGYTNDSLVIPMFVYHLYSPDNGPNSKTIENYLETCFPSEDIANQVDRSPSGAFDSPNNMKLMYTRVIPCLQSKSVERGFISKAYIEALKAHPITFSKTILEEMALFLRYGNPYILRWQNNASNNYGCTDMRWCVSQRESRSSWDYQNPVISIYEKIAVKVFQAYLVPIGLISKLTPEQNFLPYIIAFFITAFLALFASKGRTRFLALMLIGFITYTAAIVIAGLGFTERYAAMLAPIQTAYSAVVWVLIFRILYSIKLRFFG